MKAISLWQPWASAMAVNSKRYETRHWSTNVRGPVVIHAAQRRVVNELIYYSSLGPWVGALEPLRADLGREWNIVNDLPFGALVAVGNLVDCVPTDDIRLSDIDEKREPLSGLRFYSWTERHVGNYDLGRFAWIFEDLRPLTEPIPFKGSQGFFNVPDELLEGKFC